MARITRLPVIRTMRNEPQQLVLGLPCELVVLSGGKRLPGPAAVAAKRAERRAA